MKLEKLKPLLVVLLQRAYQLSSVTVNSLSKKPILHSPHSESYKGTLNKETVLVKKLRHLDQYPDSIQGYEAGKTRFTVFYVFQECRFNY